MATVLQYLKEYASVLGERSLAADTVIWIMGALGIIMGGRYLILYRNHRINIRGYQEYLLRSELSTLIGIGYGIALLGSLVIVGLLQTSLVVWNYIAAPIFGLLLSLFVEYKVVRVSVPFTLISVKPKTSSSDSNISTEVNTIEAAAELTPLERFRLKKHTNTSNEPTLSDRVDKIETEINTIEDGLTATIDAVQGITDTLGEFKDSLTRIEKQVNEISTSVLDIQDSSEEQKAIQARVRILRFNSDLVLSKKHSETLPKDMFDQTLLDIDMYSAYCEAHPKFKDSITKSAAKHIQSEYDRCTDQNSFLQY